MKHWGVSEPTSKTALGFLVDHNLIIAKPRSGYVVCQHYRSQALILLQLLDTTKLPPPPNWRSKIELMLAEPPKKGFTIGVIFDDPSLRSLLESEDFNLNYQSVALESMQALNKEAVERNCAVEWFFRNGSKEIDEEIHLQILEKKLSGIIFFRQVLFSPVDSKSDFPIDPFVERLVSEGVLVVTVLDELQNRNVACVKFNNFGIGYDAASRLIKAGHRDLVAITAPRKRDTLQERLDGFYLAIKEHNARSRQKVRHQVISAGPHAPISVLLKKALDHTQSRPTGLFFTSYYLAKDTCQVFEGMGLTVPEDISIIACGRTTTKDSSRPKADLYSFDFRLVGKLSFQILHDRVSGKATERVNLVDTELCSNGAVLTFQNC